METALMIIVSSLAHRSSKSSALQTAITDAQDF
jgi:hypothetical protein